jgi:hypothetical protein
LNRTTLACFGQGGRRRICLERSTWRRFGGRGPLGDLLTPLSLVSGKTDVPMKSRAVCRDDGGFCTLWSLPVGGGMYACLFSVPVQVEHVCQVQRGFIERQLVVSSRRARPHDVMASNYAVRRDTEPRSGTHRSRRLCDGSWSSGRRAACRGHAGEGSGQRAHSFGSFLPLTVLTPSRLTVAIT